MKIKAFSIRNAKELLRDPLSYIFCLGFPIVMLLIMTIVNQSIPAEANMTIFNIENLCGGIAVFGFAFVMLFTTISVSKDRESAFLKRLYTTPMKASDFILGYSVPFVLLGVFQILITFVTSFIIGMVTGYSFNILNMLFALILLLPTIILFIGFGFIFGSLFNDKAAPGVSSIIITLAAILGGIWMDVDSLGGGLLITCKSLPFYYSVKLVRSVLNGVYSMDNLWIPFLIVLAWAVVIFVVAILLFNSKMKKDAQ